MKQLRIRALRVSGSKRERKSLAGARSVTPNTLPDTGRPQRPWDTVQKGANFYSLPICYMQLNKNKYVTTIRRKENHVFKFLYFP